MFDPPPGDDDPAARSTSRNLATARSLGDRLLAAVRPVRVLNAVRWDESVEQQFLAAGGRELPDISPASYRPLPFDPALKRAELTQIEADARRRLGTTNPLGRLVR